MKSLIQLWDLYRDPSAESLEGLGDLVEVDGNSVVFCWASLSGVEDIGLGRDFESTLDELPPIIGPDVRLRLAARIVLRDAVNAELAAGTKAAIDVKDGSQVVLIPKDLRGAMYVQFAQELIGKSVPAVACAACGAYFIPEHGRQKYCDERCKFKGYRQRKKKMTETNDGS